MKSTDVALALGAFALVIGVGMWLKRRAAASSAANPDPQVNNPWGNWPSVNEGGAI